MNETERTMQSDHLANGSHSDSADVLRKQYGITEEDLAAIGASAESVAPMIDEFVDAFYVWLEEWPEHDEFFHDDQLVLHVKKLQHAYWTRFFSGSVDDEYVTDRRRVGATHARIGLPMHVYFAAMNLSLEQLVALVSETDGAGDLVRSITKLIHLDTGVVVQEYARVVGETLASQSRSLMEMSTPVTQLWDDILMLPAVGIIDSKRAQDIMDAVLRGIAETKARNFILDISGVAVVDTAVANHLIKITKATALMGCECVISGVSPAIAQTIVELGIDVGKVRTTANMRDALSGAFGKLGLRLGAARA